MSFLIKLHNAFIDVIMHACLFKITIRDVQRFRRMASARRYSANQCRSFFVVELERIASRPTLEAWFQKVRERKDAAGTRVTPTKILRAVAADRK